MARRIGRLPAPEDDTGESPVPVRGPRPAAPESHGWLRRPEFDEGTREAWELPAGEIRIAPSGPRRLPGRRG